MQTRKIFAGAFAAAIAIDLDVMEQVLRRPIGFRFVQHPRESERRFKKRPAIHPLKIHGRRLDAVVDLEGEMFIARAEQRLAYGGRSLADRQRSPVIAFGKCDQPIKLITPFKNRAERQVRLARERN